MLHPLLTCVRGERSALKLAQRWDLMAEMEIESVSIFLLARQHFVMKDWLMPP